MECYIFKLLEVFHVKKSYFLLFSVLKVTRHYIFCLFSALQETKSNFFLLFSALKVTNRYIFQLLEAIDLTAISIIK